jgi:hypothetical protein
MSALGLFVAGAIGFVLGILLQDLGRRDAAALFAMCGVGAMLGGCIWGAIEIAS